MHKPFLHVLNLVRTKHIPGVKRGARTKAMAICTQNQHLHIFKPLLLLALDAFFEKGEERLVILVSHSAAMMLINYNATVFHTEFSMPSMPWIFRHSLCSVTKKRGSFVLLMTRRGQYRVDFLKPKRTNKTNLLAFQIFQDQGCVLRDRPSHEGAHWNVSR